MLNIYPRNTRRKSYFQEFIKKQRRTHQYSLYLVTNTGETSSQYYKLTNEIVNNTWENSESEDTNNRE